MNIEIITPGEKIKKLRKLYNIKQNEITGDKITRNMISMIENDKAGLTETTARLLIENIKRICKEKGHEIDISLDYLMESGQEQGEKISKEFIEILARDPNLVFKKEFENYIRSVENIMEKYDLKKEKFIVYRTLGKLHKQNFNYYSAYTYYLKAFKNCSNLFNNVNLIELILETTLCCGNLHHYKEGLDFIQLAYIYMSNMPVDLFQNLKYNEILFLKQSGEYDKCLQEIDKVGDKLTKSKIYILMIKANCLKEKKLYNSAIEIHEKIVQLSIDSIETQLVTFCNLLEIYEEINDTKNINKYLDKCIFALTPYKNVNNKTFSPSIYHEIALGYYKINQLEMSKKYFSEALVEARYFNNKAVITSSLGKLLSILSKENNENDILKLKNTLFETISLDLLPANDIIIFDFIKYFNKINDSNTVDDIIKFVKKNYKEGKKE